nr:MAG TPA: hypothetical protein [Caudoviricetes sp.]
MSLRSLILFSIVSISFDSFSRLLNFLCSLSKFMLNIFLPTDLSKATRMFSSITKNTTKKKAHMKADIIKSVMVISITCIL